MGTTRLERLRAAVLAALVACLSAAGAAAQEGGMPAVFADVNAALESQRTGVPYRWQDERRRQGGTIIVNRTFYRGSQPCRDYTRTTEVGGTLISTTQGTGCRIGDGVWSLTEETPRMTNVPPPPPATAPAGDAGDGAVSEDTDEPLVPAFTLPPPDRKPVLIHASRPTPSVW